MAMKGDAAAPRTRPAGLLRAAPGLRADHLTLARLLLLPLPVAMLYQPAPGWRVAAFVLFLLLGLTDVWDGRLARRQGSSRFGELLDIVADRVFLVVAYGAFANLGIVPVTAFVFIVAREFIVGAVRALPTVEARTGKAGKWRTTAQMYGAGVILLTSIALGPSRPEAARAAILLLTALILAVTAATAAAYLWRARSEIAAGVKGRPMEIVAIASAVSVVPLLWAPLVDRGAVLSFAAIALTAGELVRLLFGSDLLPGRAGESGRLERLAPRVFRRFSILAGVGLSVRLLVAAPGGAAAALALALATAAWTSFGVATRFRRVASVSTGPPGNPPRNRAYSDVMRLP